MNSSPLTCIVDYGVGNLRSVQKAFERSGSATVITDDPIVIKTARALVLPGVGSFEAGANGLKVRGLFETVQDYARSDRPILGICLGAQLLLSKGYEFGEFNGLDIIPGEVKQFPNLPEPAKIPHIGWNSILPPSNWGDTILRDTPAGADVYFVHSYILIPRRPENILAECEYGGYKFCAAVKTGNVYGCQFHPEKSGAIGLQIIKSFINLIQ